MKEIITLFMIAIALSMDTFSLSLAIGTNNISKKKILFLSILIGLFHFFMPIIGNILGKTIINILSLSADIIFSIILFYLAISMFLDSLKEEKKAFKLNLKEMILIATSVSLDSFSTGIGINAITSNIFLAVLIFSVVSALFTYLGLLLGKYANNLIGKKATIIGCVILILLGIYELCK